MKNNSKKVVFLPIISIVLIAFIILVAFSPLWNNSSEAKYPWGSDTLGHLLKAEYLRAEITQGHFFPEFFPYWYNGHQLFRYYPPLPYYLLVLLSFFTGDMISAGHWFVILVCLISAFTFLLFSRWVGWGAASIAGLFFALSPDNLRVALSEGNLPRALTTALLPALVYYFVRLLIGEGKRIHFFLCAILILIITLSHAMMAAIFSASLGLVALIYLSFTRHIRDGFKALSSLIIGLTLSAFWLLPSLTGGISELNQQAVTEALAVFPLSTYLNPLLRFDQREILYVGLALVFLAGIGLFFQENRKPFPLSIFIVGVLTILISTPGFNTLFNSLPAHQLFWPIRFLSFSTMSLTLCLAFLLSASRKIKIGFFFIPIFCLTLAFDAWPSMKLLIFQREAPLDILKISNAMKNNTGWREATLDFSRLGSAPAYFFTANSAREQVFGWAYQGTCTAPTVSALNSALETSNWDFVIQILDILGVDDIVVLQDNAEMRQFARLLPENDYLLDLQKGNLKLFHRDGIPRGLILTPQALGIGFGANNFAAIFPGLFISSSPYVDEYDLNYLKLFPFLVLSRFNWHDQISAEALMRAYAEQGGTILVDLNGAPEDPLAREPRFLDVYGERIRIYNEPVQIILDSQTRTLQPFAEQQPWVAIVPQGDLNNTVPFIYHDLTGIALGYADYGQGKIWFIGLNLPYHTLLTHDPVGLAVMEEIMPVPASEPIKFPTVPLDDYQANQEGYTFTYHLENNAELLIPVAGCQGMTVSINGQQVPNHSLYNLITFSAPSGQHQVSISFEPTSIYFYGKIVSLIGLVFVFVALVVWKGESHEKL